MISRSTTPYRRRITVAAWVVALAALSISTISAAKIYRWVDANGVVQYSDKPPAKQQAEAITVRGAKARPEPPQAANTGSEFAPTETKPDLDAAEPARPSPEQQAAIAAARAENCRRAQSNLQFLQNNPPNRLLDTDESGNVYRLTVEDHTARMQKANDAIGKYCDG